MMASKHTCFVWCCWFICLIVIFWRSEELEKNWISTSILETRAQIEALRDDLIFFCLRLMMDFASGDEDGFFVFAKIYPLELYLEMDGLGILNREMGYEMEG